MALTRIALFFICIIVIIAEAKGKGKRGHRARKEAQQLRSTAEYYTNKLRFGHDGIRDYFQYETNKERSDRRRRYNYYASGYQHRNKPNHRDRESTYSDSHHKKRNKDGTDGTASFCHNGCQINIDWQMCAAILISGIVMGLICTCLVLMLGWHKFKWKSGNHYSDHMVCFYDIILFVLRFCV